MKSASMLRLLRFSSSNYQERRPQKLQLSLTGMKKKNLQISLFFWVCMTCFPPVNFIAVSSLNPWKTKPSDRISKSLIISFEPYIVQQQHMQIYWRCDLIPPLVVNNLTNFFVSRQSITSYSAISQHYKPDSFSETVFRKRNILSCWEFLSPKANPESVAFL